MDKFELPMFQKVEFDESWVKTFGRGYTTAKCHGDDEDKGK